MRVWDFSKLLAQEQEQNGPCLSRLTSGLSSGLSPKFVRTDEEVHFLKLRGVHDLLKFLLFQRVER